MSVKPSADPWPPPPGMLSVTIYYLEMTAPPLRPSPPAPVENTTLMRAEHPTLSFYRYLYDTVGEPWLWCERRRMSDHELAAVVQDPAVEVWVLYCGGTPAGFAELNRNNAAVVELSYFGLIPDFIGLKLGPYFLEQVVARAWSYGPCWRLGVNTCSHDHPSALPLYRKVGFQPVRQANRFVADPRIAGWLPRAAGPHIPLAEEMPEELDQRAGESGEK